MNACRFGLFFCLASAPACHGDGAADAGVCGPVETLCGDACIAGECLVTLASGQFNPGGLLVASASDASQEYAFWTTYLADGGVFRVATAGGAVSTIARDEAYAVVLGANDGTVYWSAHDPPELLSCSLSGCDGGETVTATSYQEYDSEFQDGYRYWGAGGDILVQAPDGKTSTLVGDGSAGAWALAGSSLYWADVPDDEDLDGGVTPGGIYTESITNLVGGETPTLIATVVQPEELVADQANLYWTDCGTGDSADGDVMLLSFSGQYTKTLASGRACPIGIAIDVMWVYWVDSGLLINDYRDGAVLKVPIGGGEITTLAASQPRSTSLALDTFSVYWLNTGNCNGDCGPMGTDNTEGSVMKLTPK
jgi:hypothetical protein